LFTVKPFVRVTVPPPGPELLTDTFRGPVAAVALIVIFAVMLVSLSTVVEFTVMPDPKLTELTPLMKWAPVKVTSSVCRRLPLVGAILARVGAGLFTVKVRALEVPPPGAGLKTVMLNVPAVSKSIAEIAVVSWVPLTKVVVKSYPSSCTTESDVKFVPLTVREKPASPTVLLVGERLVMVGTGFFTVKPLVRVAVPPPGVAFLTDTSRGPVGAAAPIVILALILVPLLTVVEFTVMPDPKITELTPLMKWVPVKVTSSVCRRLPLVGEILVKVGAGLFTVTSSPADQSDMIAV